VASQPLQTIRWSTPVDLAPQYQGGELLIHYGSPLVTANNTVLVPVKTSATGAFRIEAHNGGTGQLMWQVTTDYTTPASSWTPSFSPVLTPQGRLYFPGAGGTVYYLDNPDSPTTPIVHQLAFYGLNNYTAAPATFNTNVQISTPITSDSAGDIFFGFIVNGNTGIGLQSGLARINAGGQGTWAAAATIAGDPNIVSVDYNCAPALSNDGKTVYVAVNRGDFGQGYLLALNSTSLSQTGRALLFDPKSGQPAELPNISTASPVVAPDGDVYFGVFEDPFPENNDRGWLLHFTAALTQTKTPGAFGWDDTPSIVPVSMVPSYHGTSTYLLMAKYNNYAGIGTGDGQNKVAILDPNSQTSVDPVTGVTVMNPVLSILGPTPDSDHTGGVREWCINAAAVDPATDSILVNSEDGTLYRWDLSSNTFTQKINLAPPTGEAYTPTVIGGDGAVYAINNATLWAVGALPQLSIADTSANQSTSATLNAIFTVTLAQPDSASVTVGYATADGTAVAGTDYVQTTGSLTFAPGQTSQTISVPVLPTTVYSPGKSFTVTLNGPVNAVISGATAVGAIINPLPLPAISINNVTAGDGHSGVTPFDFTVSLSSASSQTIKVHYATVDGTAVAPTDYTAASGDLTFAPGQTSQTVAVSVVASPSKPIRTFTVQLSGPTNATILAAQGTGTILNDEGALSISDASGALSPTSTTNFTFTISLADPVEIPVSVQVATRDGTAVAGVDYQSLPPTQVTFAPGETSKQVTVVVNSNPNPGPTKSFSVVLSNPSNAALVGATGIGAIANNNIASVLAFTTDHFQIKETAGGLTISVVRSGDLTRTVTVQFTAGPKDSSPATEYIPFSRTLTFHSGDQSQNIIFSVLDDHQINLDQLAQLTLSNPSTGGQLGTPSTAVLTIKDDDGTPNQRYVFHSYLELLNRPADSGGLAYWSGLLNSGFARSQMILGLDSSPEYRVVQVNSYYKTYLGRTPTSAELAAGTSLLVAPQAPGAPTPQNALRAQILGTAEYFANRGNGNNTGFLAALYQDLLGRSIDPVGSSVFGSMLATGGTRTQVALVILQSKETDQVFVQGWYNAFLNRPGDTGGINFFTDQLQHGSLESSVLAGMLGSDEFFALSQ
jgi:hypothetical protein